MHKGKILICTAGAVLGIACAAIFVMLGLASGYSGKFLGLWTPPNSDEFRRTVGVGTALSLLTTLVLGSLAVWNGLRRD
jgi:hypothetical protein